ncbi:MAG: flagellar motor switch protein [Rhodobacteraceae bacterium]|nr:flagellar motor switch protein [Paracoccaceae bacterium]
MITLIINGFILTLLVGAIGYIYLVDLRVRKLLSALNGLEPMVGQFSKAVDRSELSLEKLKEVEARKTASPETPGTAEDHSDDEKKVIFKPKKNVMKAHVGWVSVPGKSELVRSFFETARGQEP